LGSGQFNAYLAHDSLAIRAFLNVEGNLVTLDTADEVSVPVEKNVLLTIWDEEHLLS
jgi:hypothetical protein